MWSAITGAKTEIGRMHICNVGGTQTAGDYDGETFIGRDSDALDRRNVSKKGHLDKYPRLRLHVWNLVARMLSNMGYK